MMKRDLLVWCAGKACDLVLPASAPHRFRAPHSTGNLTEHACWHVVTCSYVRSRCEKTGKRQNAGTQSYSCRASTSCTPERAESGVGWGCEAGGGDEAGDARATGSQRAEGRSSRSHASYPSPDQTPQHRCHCRGVSNASSGSDGLRSRHRHTTHSSTNCEQIRRDQATHAVTHTCTIGHKHCRGTSHPGHTQARNSRRVMHITHTVKLGATTSVKASTPVAHQVRRPTGQQGAAGARCAPRV